MALITPKPTQKSRVLDWLEDGRPARQTDWLRMPAVDGCEPITRLAAIVGFLRDDGHVIAARPVGRGRVEYVLAEDAA